MGQEESTLVGDDVRPHTLSARTLSAVADYIKSGEAKRIVVLTGAGISTGAGIPDFRSPKTGLYNNLARLDLPYAEAVFDISYFRKNPEPFYVLANELYPGKFYPTVSHAFIALLAKKGLLQMLFTQNIDCLERRAGVPADKIVEAHGSFATQRCIDCKTEFPDTKMQQKVFKGEVPRCENKGCGGLVKPDIVFFGEALPKAFEQNSYVTSLAEVVLVIGTSLTVYPFARLPEMAKPGAPRVLFNMERVGQMGSKADDVIELGPCDDGIRKLADLLGWRNELEALWRGVVGEKEAERQLKSQVQHEEEVEDEVDKLAGDVDAALKFDGSEYGEPKAPSATTLEDEDGAQVPKLRADTQAQIDSELAGIPRGEVAHQANAMDSELGSLLASKQKEEADHEAGAQKDAVEAQAPAAAPQGSVSESHKPAEDEEQNKTEGGKKAKDPSASL